MSRQELENTIVNHLLQFNPIKVGIFGSYARFEEKADSDLDLLVNFKFPLSLIELIHIENSLSKKIGIKVDLVTENSIQNSKLKGYINKDLQVIYNA